MSYAHEIQDNRWEFESIKPPIGNPAALTQMLLMGAFSLFFVWVMIHSFIGLVTPTDENAGLGAMYENMNKQQQQSQAQ